MLVQISMTLRSWIEGLWEGLLATHAADDGGFSSASYVCVPNQQKQGAGRLVSAASSFLEASGASSKPGEQASRRAAYAEQAGKIYNAKSLSKYPFEQALKDAEQHGLQKPCDKFGRIGSAKDGHFCDGPDACVTNLPLDFGARSQDMGDPFCWRLTCPNGMPAESCPAPQWENQCIPLAGHPWCVPPDYLKRYGRPIEVSCSASGPEAELPGSPTGCWWLKKYAHADLQRLPGPILSRFQPDKGWFVDHGPALTENEAERWIRFGRLDPMPEPVKGN